MKCGITTQIFKIVTSLSVFIVSYRHLQTEKGHCKLLWLLQSLIKMCQVSGRFRKMIPSSLSVVTKKVGHFIIVLWCLLEYCDFNVSGDPEICNYLKSNNMTSNSLNRIIFWEIILQHISNRKCFPRMSRIIDGWRKKLQVVVMPLRLVDSARQ